MLRASAYNMPRIYHYLFCIFPCESLVVHCCSVHFFVLSSSFFRKFLSSKSKTDLSDCFIRKFQWRSTRCYHLLLARRIAGLPLFFLAILLYFGLHRQVNLRTRQIYRSILKIETRRPMQARLFVQHSECMIWLHDELVLCKWTVFKQVLRYIGVQTEMQLAVQSSAWSLQLWASA